MIFTDRLGIRIGDIFADTQVVDGKVMAKGEATQPLATATPAPPSSSASARTGLSPRRGLTPAAMRIALTHNLRLSEAEDEAEFDTRETVDALAAALERLGHRVERIEVSGPASRTVARLEAFGPDLIFNTAEGRRGRFREAFFPALFDELGMPYTGSDAYALALTLDKQLTKLVLAQHGVAHPALAVRRGRSAQLQVNALRYPVIVKPNFEGSSKGITQDSVVEDPLRLHEVVRERAGALPGRPAGRGVHRRARRDRPVPGGGGPGAGRRAPAGRVRDRPGRRREPALRHLRLRAQDQARPGGLACARRPR